MSAASQLSDEHTLYVVMNGHIVGDINRTGKNRARLRYEDVAADDFTPLSVSMPGPPVATASAKRVADEGDGIVRSFGRRIEWALKINKVRKHRVLSGYEATMSEDQI